MIMILELTGLFSCRHAIAVMHFNKNLCREKKMKNGVEQYNVVYPKFMNGEAVVRKVSVKQNFGMQGLILLPSVLPSSQSHCLRKNILKQ